MEGNNKKSKTIIIILVLIIIALGGYLVYDNFIKGDTKETTKEVTKTTKTESAKFKDKNDVVLKDKSKEVVYDLVNKKIDTMVETDTGYVQQKVSYMLPVINLKGKYAEEINEEIKSLAKDEGYPVFYKKYINDNILSVVIEDSGNYTPKYAYNINLYTGEKVPNDELLKVKNLKEADVYKLIYDFTSKYIKEVAPNHEVSEVAYADTEQMSKMFLGSKMFLNDKKELIIRAYYSPLTDALTAHSIWFNVDQNNSTKITE